MPPRGSSARGGVTRGGPARGGAVRGAPAGRGGPAAASVRGSAAPRARPPTGGPPQRMAAPPGLQHTSSAAAESYDDYVRTNSVMLADLCDVSGGKRVLQAEASASP